MKKLLTSLLTITALCNLIPAQAKASIFGNVEVNPNQFVVVASPFGINQQHYQLLIIEQLSNARPCWREYGSNPVMVEPLLLNFDFTGICNRSTDGNNYSIRIGSEDLGGRYLLSAIRQGNELLLVGSSLREPNVPPIVIGRTGGIGRGYHKVVLDPGWRLTRRTYQGRVLGHLYLTGDPTVVNAPPANAGSVSLPPGDRTRPLPGITLPPPEREIIFTPSPSGSSRPPLPPRDRANPLPPAPSRPTQRRTVPTF